MKTQNTMSEASLGGHFTFAQTSLTVHRMGYGAMQLAGPGVFGPPKDRESAVALLREAATLPKKRRPTKPTRSSKEKRLEKKKTHSRLKQTRSKRFND